MTCPQCGSSLFERAENAPPVNRDGIVLRMKQCLNPPCRHAFVTAELVVTDEYAPVVRLDRVLRAYMDESDARVMTEIEDESLEALTAAEVGGEEPQDENLWADSDGLCRTCRGPGCEWCEFVGEVPNESL